MIFVEIDGKKLDEIRLEDYVDFFQEHIFFKFMDGGRSGMQAGVTDLIDNSIKRSLLIHTDRTKLAKILESRAFYDTMYHEYMPRIMNAFITGGTVAMRTAIFMTATDQRLFNSNP